MNRQLVNKIVAIIGGGPGGLTLGTLLQQKNIQVNIFERDKNKFVRQQGATLDLHEESGLKAIKQAGLFNQFKSHYRPGAEKLRIVNKDADIVFDEHHSTVQRDFGDQHFRPEIDRGPLRDILIESLQPNTIIWDSHLMNMTIFEKGWKLYFENGKSSYADLVIGADGANSKVRSFITDTKPIYSDITIVEGNIYDAKINAPRLWQLVKGGKIFALGSEKSIISSAKGDGSLSFYTGTKETEGWLRSSKIDFSNRQEIFSWFQHRFDDWSNLWHELFQSENSYFIPRPMYHYPLQQAWPSLPNLTIIGDAAHCMPPYAGEGVNMAMQDSLELCEALTNTNVFDLKQAIQLFEKQMLQRASVATAETLENTRMIHSPNGLNDIVNFFQQNNSST